MQDAFPYLFDINHVVLDPFYYYSSEVILLAARGWIEAGLVKNYNVSFGLINGIL